MVNRKKYLKFFSVLLCLMGCLFILFGFSNVKVSAQDFDSVSADSTGYELLSNNFVYSDIVKKIDFHFSNDLGNIYISSFSGFGNIISTKPSYYLQTNTNNLGLSSTLSGNYYFTLTENQTNYWYLRNVNYQYSYSADYSELSGMHCDYFIIYFNDFVYDSTLLETHGIMGLSFDNNSIFIDSLSIQYFGTTVSIGGDLNNFNNTYNYDLDNGVSFSHVVGDNRLEFDIESSEPFYIDDMYLKFSFPTNIVMPSDLNNFLNLFSFRYYEKSFFDRNLNILHFMSRISGGSSSLFDYSSWLVSTVGDILEIPILPNFSIFNLLMCAIAIPLLIYILKLFLGG